MAHHPHVSLEYAGTLTPWATSSGLGDSGAAERERDEFERQQRARGKLQALLRRAQGDKGVTGLGLLEVDEPPVREVLLSPMDIEPERRRFSSHKPTSSISSLASLSSLGSFDSSNSLSSFAGLVNAFPVPPSTPSPSFAFGFPPPADPPVAPNHLPTLHFSLFSHPHDGTDDGEVPPPTPPLSLSGSETPRRQASFSSFETDGPHTPKLGSPVKLSVKVVQGSPPRSSSESTRSARSSPEKKASRSGSRPVSAFFNPERPPTMPLPPIPPPSLVPLPPTPTLRHASSTPTLRPTRSPSLSVPSSLYPTPPDSAASSAVDFAFSSFPSAAPSPTDASYKLPDPAAPRLQPDPSRSHAPQKLLPPPPSPPPPRSSSLEQHSFPSLPSPSSALASPPAPPPVPLTHARLRTLSAASHLSTSSITSTASSLQLENITAALDALIDGSPTLPGSAGVCGEADLSSSSSATLVDLASPLEAVAEREEQSEEDEEKRRKDEQREAAKEQRLLRRVTSAVSLMREQRSLTAQSHSQLPRSPPSRDGPASAPMGRKGSVASMASGSSSGGSAGYGPGSQYGYEQGRWSMASGMSGWSAMSGREDGWQAGGYKSYKLARRPSRYLTSPPTRPSSRFPETPILSHTDSRSRSSSASSASSGASSSSSGSSASEELFDLSFDLSAATGAAAGQSTGGGAQGEGRGRLERERWSWIEKGLGAAGARRRSSATTADGEEGVAGKDQEQAPSPVKEEDEEEAQEVLASPPRRAPPPSPPSPSRSPRALYEREEEELAHVDSAFAGLPRLPASRALGATPPSLPVSSGLPSPRSRTLHTAKSSPQLRLPRPSTAPSTPPTSFLRRPSAPPTSMPSYPLPPPPVEVTPSTPPHAAPAPTSPIASRLKPLMTASRRPLLPTPSASAPAFPAQESLLKQPSASMLHQSPSRGLSLLRRPSAPALSTPSSSSPDATPRASSPSGLPLARPRPRPSLPLPAPALPLPASPAAVSKSATYPPPSAPPGGHTRRLSLATLPYTHSTSSTSSAPSGASAAALAARKTGRGGRGMFLPTLVAAAAREEQERSEAKGKGKERKEKVKGSRLPVFGGRRARS